MTVKLSGQFFISKLEQGTQYNQPFCLQFCQMFTDYKIVLTTKVSDYCRVK